MLAVQVDKRTRIFDRAGKQLAEIALDWSFHGRSPEWTVPGTVLWLGGAIGVCEQPGGDLGENCRLFSARGKLLKNLGLLYNLRLYLPDVAVANTGDMNIQFIGPSGRVIRQLEYEPFDPPGPPQISPIFGGSLDGAMFIARGDGLVIEYRPRGAPTTHLLPCCEADFRGLVVTVGPDLADREAAEAFLARSLDAGLPRHGEYPKVVETRRLYKGSHKPKGWHIVAASPISHATASILARHLPDGVPDQRIEPGLLEPEFLRLLVLESVSGLKGKDHVDWSLLLETDVDGQTRCVQGGGACFPVREASTVRRKAAGSTVALPFVGKGSRAILSATLRRGVEAVPCVVHVGGKDPKKELELDWNVTTIRRVRLACRPDTR